MNFRGNVSTAMTGLLNFLRHNGSGAIRLFPVALAATLLISLGGELQWYLFSMMSGDSLTVYEAAYGRGLVQIPAWDIWIFRQSTLALLAVAMIAVTWAFRKRDARSVLLRLWAAFALGITIVDVGATYFAKTTRTGYGCQNTS